MAKICVASNNEADERFTVTVEDDASKNAYSVAFSDAYHEALTGGKVTKVAAIAAAFQFLLAREPKESILPRFDLQVINRYFPEFDREWRNYL